MPSPSMPPWLLRISARAMCPVITATTLPKNGSPSQPRMPNTRLMMESALVGRDTNVGAGGSSAGGDSDGEEFGIGSVVIVGSQRSNLMPCASGSASE
jgi:hypothetical protein